MGSLMDEGLDYVGGLIGRKVSTKVGEGIYNTRVKLHKMKNEKAKKTAALDKEKEVASTLQKSGSK